MSMETTTGLTRILTNGSRPATTEENEISNPSSGSDVLLTAIIVLAIIVLVLFSVIIYGYFKYVRKGDKEEMESEGEGEGRERSKNMREPNESIEQPSFESAETSQFSVPVKLRKRSMTFSETDEECRKYREDLADSYATPDDGVERSRKKSVVTFVGVEEIDANEP